MKSNCLNCCNTFEHTVPQKYCNKECRLIATHGVCMICKKVMQGKYQNGVGYRAHLECIKEFGISRVCEYVKCNKVFTARTLGAKFCCRNHAVQQSQVRKGLPCTVCGEPVQKQTRGSASPTHRDCALPLPPTSRTSHIRRMPKGLRDEVLVRDNMICQMCFLPCSKVGGRLDDNYPTIDHIVPLVSFLHLSREDAIKQANELSNLRCAHRKCNLQKNRF